MRDLIRLVEGIHAVIKQFLAQPRFCIPANEFKQQQIETILSNLILDINHYKNNQVVTHQAGYQSGPLWAAAKAVSTGPQRVYNHVYNKAESNLRYYTNTDGSYRLSTLDWLNWTRRELTSYIASYERLTSTEEINSFQATLTQQVRSFFSAINRIVKDTYPNKESAFTLARGEREFLIYGLKESKSELAKLMGMHLLDEFNCEYLITAINNDLSRVIKKVHDTGLRQKEMLKQQQLEASVQQLEKNNAALLQELEKSHNSVKTLQADLHGSVSRSEKLGNELRIKATQEATFERRIERLIKDKQSLEHVYAERRAFLADKAQLQEEVRREQEKQEALQTQLTEVREENIELASKLNQPAAIISDEADEDYYDEESSDGIDVDALSRVLNQHVSGTELIEQVALGDEEVNLRESGLDALMIASPKKEFPLFSDESENGCTNAQLYVINCQPKHLHNLLKIYPDAVNSICNSSDKNPLSKRTLLELALFDVKALKPVKARRAVLEAILQYRPYLMDTHKPVLDEVKNRLVNKGCDEQMRDTFCQYVVSQVTCSSEARSEMIRLMGEIETTYAALLNSPCAKLLSEMRKPMEVCQLLKAGYLNGSFSKLDPLLKLEPSMDYAEVYEVLYDKSQKEAADEQHYRKYNKKALRTKLLDTLFESLKGCQKLMLSPGNNSDDLVRYSKLLDNVMRIINRYGVVLCTKGFNRYQQREIALQIKEEALLAYPPQDVKDFASGYRF